MTTINRSLMAAMVAATLFFNLNPEPAFAQAPAPAPAPAAAPAPKAKPAPADRSNEEVVLSKHLFPKAARLLALRAKDAELRDLIAGAEAVKGSVDTRVGKLSGAAQKAVTPIVPLPGTTVGMLEAQIAQITPELDALEAEFQKYMDSLKCERRPDNETLAVAGYNANGATLRVEETQAALAEPPGKKKRDLDKVPDHLESLSQEELDSRLEEAETRLAEAEAARDKAQADLDNGEKAWKCDRFDEAVGMAVNEAEVSWAPKPQRDQAEAAGMAAFVKDNPKPKTPDEIRVWEARGEYVMDRAVEQANLDYRGEATDEACGKAQAENNDWTYLLPEVRLLYASACAYGLPAERLKALGLSKAEVITIEKEVEVEVGGGFALPQGLGYGARFLSLFGGEGDGAYTAVGPQAFIRVPIGPLVPELQLGVTWARSRLDRADSSGSTFKARPAITTTVPLYLHPNFAVFAETGWLDYGAILGAGVRWVPWTWLDLNAGYVRGFGLNGSADNTRLGRSLPGELSPNLFGLWLSAHTN